MDTTLELPPLPAAHARALNIMGDSSVEFGAVARVIESDPALTAAILRAANSAYSAPIDRIDTANIAIVRLGLEDTRRMVLGAITSSAFADLHRAEVDADETWRHLVATALLAQAATWHEGNPRDQVSEAFTAGMLHDIGRLSMATQDPVRYSLVVSLAGGGADLMEAEMRMFAYDHASWGAKISEAWKLPDGVSDAIAHHHEDRGGELARAVFAAREIAWSLGIGDGVLAPDDETYPATPEHEAIVGRLGGPDGLFKQMDRYRGALEPAAA